jgi:Ca2+:H+ antiporter
VIVAIAGNAVENVAGIALASAGQSDRLLTVMLGVTLTTALLAGLYPALVLLSLLFATHLTFVLQPVYIGALGITALALWQITGDGEAHAFEGWGLISLYVIVAVFAYFE